MTKALVTGGCGFAGRHLVKRLLEVGYEVWIIDDLSTGIGPGAWLRPGSVKFIHENLALTMLKALGTISNDSEPLPSFDYVFALASIVWW